MKGMIGRGAVYLWIDSFVSLFLPGAMVRVYALTSMILMTAGSDVSFGRGIDSWLEVLCAHAINVWFII
jgi:hypothetical protein